VHRFEAGLPRCQYTVSFVAITMRHDSSRYIQAMTTKGTVSWPHSFGRLARYTSMEESYSSLYIEVGKARTTVAIAQTGALPCRVYTNHETEPTYAHNNGDIHLFGCVSRAYDGHFGIDSSSFMPASISNKHGSLRRMYSSNLLGPISNHGPLVVARDKFFVVIRFLPTPLSSKQLELPCAEH
jgi:hypothetical protein